MINIQWSIHIHAVQFDKIIYTSITTVKSEQIEHFQKSPCDIL